MTIKTILVPLEGSETGPGLLETALTAARAFGAHLQVLHVKADPRDMMPFLAEPATAGTAEMVIEAAERSAAERAARARALFDSFCARAGLAVAIAPAAPSGSAPFAVWMEQVGLAGELVARHGRLADLVAVGRPGERDPAPVFLESALLETGRPVLVAPPDPVATLGNHVVIAWNDSPQAARAVAAAQPFLARAGKVTILTADGKDGPATAPDGLAAHLAWHGIRAAGRKISATPRDAGAALLAELRALGGDLLVMGGYGHSRVREVILGGVTQHVLESAESPVLMVH